MFKKPILILVLCLASLTVKTQNLYNPTSIKEIRLTFNRGDWDKYLDSAKKAGSETRLKGNLMLDGQRFENVGVRYKGNSSYFGTRKKGNSKLPFNIKLDKKQKLDDKYETLKLSNINRDPSFVREMLSYEIVSTYMPAPQCNFAKVYVNDKYFGLYNNVEAINEKFLKNQFGKKGWLVKCDPDWTAEEPKNCPKGDKASLMYLGEDSTCYRPFYEIDEDGNWKDFINLTRILNLEPDKIERVLNVDQVLWMLALNSVMVNLDSYTGLFSHNYYLYRIADGRFTPLMWDLNMSFGAFSMPNVEMTKLDPFFYISDTKRPLISKLLTIPMYKKIYIAHVKTILNDWFYNGKYLNRAKEITQLIDNAVKDDPNKHYSYDDFKKNMTASIPEMVDGKEVSKIIGIEELMKPRIEFLKNFPPFQKPIPTFEGQASHSAMPEEKLSIKIKVKGATRVWCLVRNDKNSAYRYLPMLDDGQHGDDAANDSVWGVVFNKKDVQYYIIAETEEAVSLLPERGGKEFFEAKFN